jgi:hypothetical protein
MNATSRHSDKEKFPGDLNWSESYEMSERLLKTLRNSGGFQAEYEGSIPVTRSKIFGHFSHCSVSIPTRSLALIRTNVRPLFETPGNVPSPTASQRTNRKY